MSLDVYLQAVRSTTIFSANVTHNMSKMASAAGIYEILWRTDETNTKLAADIIEPLRKGIELLKSDPERFKEFNPSNGWGNYECFLEFLENYLNACVENPDATISWSR